MTPLTDTTAGTDLNQLCINTIRTLSLDAVQQAKSGHPGTFLNRTTQFDPKGPLWPNRDRFVLSSGHASTLDSKAPGHPGYRWALGVDTTTGPLRQGVATSVGWRSPKNGWRTEVYERLEHGIGARGAKARRDQE